MSNFIPRTFEDSQRLGEEQISRMITREGDIYYEFSSTVGTMELFTEILITAWFRYPTYDFIFGLPTGGLELLERACMVIRHKGEGKKDVGIFLDTNELKDTIDALTQIYIRTGKDDFYKTKLKIKK